MKKTIIVVLACAITLGFTGSARIGGGPRAEAGEAPPTAESRPQGTNAGKEESQMIYPDAEWVKADPRESSLDPGALQEFDKLMQKAKSNGVLVRNGRLIAEWSYAGPIDKPFDVQSISKSFTGMILGLALDDKLIPSLDTKVKDLFPAFEAGTYSKDITFRQLATMMAGVKPSRYQLEHPEETPPGTQFNYHADQPAHLARALTYLYQQPLLAVLRQRILEPIGAKATWDIDEAPWSPVEIASKDKIAVNSGFGFIHINAPDLARVGHLFVNKGKWKDRQLISAEYVAESWTKIPGKFDYGLYWWRLAPGVWTMSGTGNQLCIVWPEYGIVLTKVNPYQFHPSGTNFAAVFSLLHRAVTGKEYVPPKEP